MLACRSQELRVNHVLAQSGHFEVISVPGRRMLGGCGMFTRPGISHNNVNVTPTPGFDVLTATLQPGRLNCYR